MNRQAVCNATSLVPVTRTSDFASIRRFAELSNDFNPIHIDREFAAASPMKGLIAHGPAATIMVLQSLHRTLGTEMTERVSLQLRFLKPVREDDTVMAGGERTGGDDHAPVFDIWVRNQAGDLIIQGTAQVRPEPAVPRGRGESSMQPSDQAPVLPSSRLGPDQIRHYRSLGYLHIPELLTNEELAAVRNACLHCETAGTSKLIGVQGGGAVAQNFSHQADDRYQRMFRSDLDLRFHFPELRGIIRKLAGHAGDLLGTKDVRILWDKTFVKSSRAEGTRETVWHQDLPFIPVDRRGLMTFWIPTEDVTVESGAMRFVPRSHRLGPIGRVDLVGEDHRLQDILTQEDLELVDEPVVVPIAAGDATVHDGLTVHGALPNLTDQPRRAWACLFVPGDTLWNGGPLSHENLLGYGLKPFRPFDHPDLMPQ